MPYQYCETNPFKKPKPTHLLEANPRGLVPAIRQGEWACSESGVILEYVRVPQPYVVGIEDLLTWVTLSSRS